MLTWLHSTRESGGRRSALFVWERSMGVQRWAKSNDRAPTQLSELWTIVVMGDVVRLENMCTCFLMTLLFRTQRRESSRSSALNAKPRKIYVIAWVKMQKNRFVDCERYLLYIP